MDRHITRWNPDDVGREGYWGAATSSIDWCEANYAISWHIAELWNTGSNIGFIALALYGMSKSIQQQLPKRCAAAWAGLAFVGFGSFLFHMTLQYSTQLLDELPMIYLSTLVSWIVLDTRPIASAPNYWIPIGLLVFDVLFTVAYLVFPNPVYHQLVYGALMVATTGRAVWLLFTELKGHPINHESRRLQAWGSAAFVWAFFIWNLDNLGCQRSTRWKQTIGAPFSWFLEGHMWWHIFVGLGAYSVIVAMSALTLCIRDSPDHYRLRYSAKVIAWIERTPEGWKEARKTSAQREREPLMGR